jgi:hypothetical protein
LRSHKLEFPIVSGVEGDFNMRGILILEVPRVSHHEGVKKGIERELC